MTITRESIIQAASKEPNGGFVDMNCKRGHLYETFGGMNTVQFTAFMESLGFDVVSAYLTQSGRIVCTSKDGYSLDSEGWARKLPVRC